VLARRPVAPTKRAAWWSNFPGPGPGPGAASPERKGGRHGGPRRRCGRCGAFIVASRRGKIK